MAQQVQASGAQASAVVAQVSVVDPNLQEASQIFSRLQDDIKLHLMEEYIKPQLRGDDLVKEFDKQLNSEECQSLEWKVLVDVVGKIIQNESALAQMFEKYEDDVSFKTYYKQHFIDNINTFKASGWDALSSFCATVTMCKWH
jgi:hypothetical protein